MNAIKKIFIEKNPETKYITWCVRITTLLIFINLCLYIQSFIKLLILCIGVIYPALRTYSEKENNKYKWIKYWIVYSSLQCITCVLDLFFSNGLYLLIKLLITTSLVFPIKSYNPTSICYNYIDKYLKDKMNGNPIEYLKNHLVFDTNRVASTSDETGTQ